MMMRNKAVHFYSGWWNCSSLIHADTIVQLELDYNRRGKKKLFLYFPQTTTSEGGKEGWEGDEDEEKLGEWKCFTIKWWNSKSLSLISN